jgi:predicted  nucleic acid-binding Zn-ribbon protein
MALQHAELAALQELDTQIDRLKRERARLDDGSALRRQRDARSEACRRGEERLHGLTANLHDSELELKTVEAKKKEFERRLYEGKVTNPKELQAMEMEIEMLGRQRGRLDEAILNLMEESETAGTELDTAKKALAAAEAAWTSADATFRSEAARLDAALRDLAARRQQAAAAIEPATLRRYDEIRARSGNPAVVRIEDKACGGCHTSIGTMIRRRLEEGTAYVFCENCNRFLLPE